ncbi:MAG: hypothetical protein AB1815_00755 [Bacillota bacterium]
MPPAYAGDCRCLWNGHKHFYALAPVHLLVADRHGYSFVWEYSHAHNREYIIEGNDSPLVVTNFLLHRYQCSADIPRVSADKGCFYNRYRTLSDLINHNQRSFTSRFIRETNTRVFLDAGSFTEPLPIPLPW